MSQAASKSQLQSYPGYWAFVDGSHRGHEMTYGVAIIRDGAEIDALQGHVAEAADLFGADLPAILASGARQIPGEITAVYRAVAWCREHDVSQVTIAHDLAGLAHWATGNWNANTLITRRLQQDAPHWPVRVKWIKVKGHSRDRFNDRADELARDALAARPVQETLISAADMGLQARKGHGFCLHLHAAEGIEAEVKGMINDLFIRVVIGAGDGYVDIYDTAKRPWHRPYIHGFRNAGIRQRIDQAWRDFAAAA